MTLSMYYQTKRSTWVTEFLVVIKAELCEFKMVDRRKDVSLWGVSDKEYQERCKLVYIEDHKNNYNLVLNYLHHMKSLLDHEDSFNDRVYESLKILRSKFPGVHELAYKKIDTQSQQGYHIFPKYSAGFIDSTKHTRNNM